MDVNQGQSADNQGSSRQWLLGVVGFSCLWIVGAVIAYTSFQDELIRFMETYLAPDGVVSSPRYTFAKFTLAPVMLALWVVLTAVTYRAWTFPKPYIFWYLIFFVAHFLFYTYYLRVVLQGADPEDTLLEWGTFVLAFIGGVIFLICAYKGSRFSIFLGLAWLLFAFEEISWGQRVLGIETPEVMLEYNYQEELNFHNLINPLQKYLYVPFNAAMLCFFTWFRRVELLAWVYRMNGVARILKVSDQYGLWMMPMFWIFASFHPGAEYVEEQWGLFGLMLAALLYRDMRRNPAEQA
ncbi:hypothetical protein TRL7639_01386 [Falsiruegeria litorea R37]|uniref:Uncharacterized protein n=1 Tax=Falsiruegeria litorea R37 TaxID=1200284 RepID=A0A1Y5S3W7_9RHOB|nr:hypothetical protein [Falsiruegeria litorea]SLN32085.1 hypothetical protein TRL7639_01386 [Falsiruegeria litorea R37]